MGWDLGLPAEQYARDTGNDPAEFNSGKHCQLQTPNQCAWFSYDWESWSQYYRIQTTTSGRNGFSPSFYEKVWLMKLKCQWTGSKNWEQLSPTKKFFQMEHRGGWRLSSCPQTNAPMDAQNHCLALSVCSSTWMFWLARVYQGYVTQLIGKSTGANVTFKVKGTDKEFTVLPTRPDTFGATFTVLVPEHDLVDAITTIWTSWGWS